MMKKDKVDNRRGNEAKNQPTFLAAKMSINTSYFFLTLKKLLIFYGMYLL